MGLIVNKYAKIENLHIKSIYGLYKSNRDFKELKSANNILKDFIGFMEDFVKEHGKPNIDAFENSKVNFERFLIDELNSSDLNPKQTLEILVEKSDLKFYNLLKEHDILYLLDESLFTNILSKYFNDGDSEDILELLKVIFTSTIEGTEIIIAGFDKENIHPSLSSCTVFGVFGGEFLYIEDENIVNSNKPFIRSFGENDTINTVVHGIDNNLILSIKENMSNLFKMIKFSFLNELKSNSEVDNIVIKLSSNIFGDIGEEVNGSIDFYTSKLENGTLVSNNEIMSLLKFGGDKMLPNLCKILLGMASIKFGLSGSIPIFDEKTQIALLSTEEGFNFLD